MPLMSNVSHQSMLTYTWFLLVALVGTLFALAASMLLRELRTSAWSTRIGCAIGGAALGSFAGALLLAAYLPLTSGVWLYAMPCAIAAAFGLVCRSWSTTSAP